MMPALVLLIKVVLLIIFQVSFSFNMFHHQNIFPLAMATKMVAAWSAAKCNKKIVCSKFGTVTGPYYHVFHLLSPQHSLEWLLLFSVNWSGTFASVHMLLGRVYPENEM